MRTTTSKSLALLTAALLCAPSAFAQVKPEPKPVPAKTAAPAVLTPPAPPAAPALPAKPTPAGFSTMAPVPAPPAPSAPRKLKVLQVPFSELESAVDLLQHALQDDGLEQMNILFGPDTRDLEVSAVTLRNVTGPDALQLIAAAAGCTVEPMFSTEGQGRAGEPMVIGARLPVIGYQLRGKPKPATTAKAAPPSSSLPVTHSVFGPVRLPSATSPASRLTRIYPLGAVTTATKFPDLEKTLREIFKADGVAENQVSLALHEKTNVLVVNASGQVHNLVEDFLTALNTNTSQADRQNTARDRAMGREELESAARNVRRLELELAERDAQMRELQKELRKLQDAAPKSPRAQ